MKRICLISLPSPFLIDEYVFPPLGILYVASGLRKQGYTDIFVHDGTVDSIPEGCNVYGIGCTTPQFEQAKKALRYIKNKNKEAKVYVGGPQATIDQDTCLESGFDGVILNAGENSLSVAFEKECKVIDIPFKEPLHPARDLIDLGKYKYYINGELATSIMTTRGCPYQCGFCCKCNKKVQIYSAEFVIEEIDELIFRYGYKALMFFDDIFILNKERAFKIMEHLKKNKIIWRAFLRADIVARHGIEFAKTMKDSGCVEVGIGVESGSDEILKTVNKGEDSATIKKGIQVLKEAGLRVKGFFIVGLPGESYSTIDETRRFVKDSGLDDMDFSIFQPFKKSPIYDNKSKYKDIDWNDLDLQASWYKGTPGLYSSQVCTPFLTREKIVEMRDTLEREFKPVNI